MSEREEEINSLSFFLQLTVDSSKNWIVLRGLCVHTHSYNPRHVTAAPQCTRLCESEPGCVMAKYSSAALLCWVSKSRQMEPLGSDCDGEFRNTYDYYVKRTSWVNREENLSVSRALASISMGLLSELRPTACNII